MTKDWVEINYALGRYNTISQIDFKTTMLKSTLCDYSDLYIRFKKTIIVANTGTVTAPNDRRKSNILHLLIA